MFEIRMDDLSGAPTRSLLAFHLAGMQANSPQGSVFALDFSGLQVPEVTVWTAWHVNRVVGVGALKQLSTHMGEVKSMRTHPDFLRQGVAGALLDRILAEARARKLTHLGLETGSGPIFDPALALYRKRGFVDGEAFAGYEKSAFNQFLHLTL